MTTLFTEVLQSVICGIICFEISTYNYLLIHDAFIITLFIRFLVYIELFIMHRIISKMPFSYTSLLSSYWGLFRIQFQTNKLIWILIYFE